MAKVNIVYQKKKAEKVWETKWDEVWEEKASESMIEKQKHRMQSALWILQDL